MSVDNMSLVGGRYSSAEVQPQSAVSAEATTQTSLAEYRRQVVAVELVMMLVVSGLSALVVSQSATAASPLLVSLAFTALWITCAVGMRAFTLHSLEGFDGLKRLMQATLLAGGVVAGAAFIFDTAAFRNQVLLTLAVGIPALLIVRYAFIRRLASLREVGSAQIGVVLVSPAGARPELAHEIADDNRMKLVGVVDPINFDAEGLIRRVVETAVADRADTVMISCTTPINPDQVRKLIWALEPHGINVLVSSRVQNYALGRVSLQHVADELVVEVDHSHRSWVALGVKRVFDVVASAALLVLFAPVILICALAIKLESPGGAFFVQPRVGKDGELFPFYKLRSMRQDAHLERADVLGPTDEGILERYRNDSRITRVGSFIRRWSIDELPQLLNVFLGHMSLVGPRPVLEAELHDLPEHGERVHIAKPGLTGMWQISGRKEIHWEDRIDLDLDYVDSWSLGLDAKIAAKTVGAVVKGSGAY